MGGGCCVCASVSVGSVCVCMWGGGGVLKTAYR